MTEEIKQTKPNLVICGGHNYEELHRMLHDSGMRCKNPAEFMNDLYSVLQNKETFSTELPEFIDDVLDGAYVDHHIYYLSFDAQRQKALDLDDVRRRQYCLRASDPQQEFSRTMLSNLAIDARHSLLNIYHKLNNGGYYLSDGRFPYVLHDFSNRALSFRPLY